MREHALCLKISSQSRDAWPARQLVFVELLDQNGPLMGRFDVLTCGGALLCLGIAGCEQNDALFTTITLPGLADAGSPAPEPTKPEVTPPPPMANTGLPSPDPAPPALPPPPVAPPDLDAGVPDRTPDAAPAPTLPRPVVAGLAAEGPLLGVEGGDPRLGVCRGGVVIGVRTTANPSDEIFGQRLTFIEPICGKPELRPESADDSSGTISVLRDNSLIDWLATDGFLGLPATVVPDSRLVWLPQPATVCPAATPVVVGLSGEYDPVAPDVPDTAAIRSLFVECAPLVLSVDGSTVVAGQSGHQLISNADGFSASGSATYRLACADGAVTTQIKVHSGFWLDGFVLGCSSLRLE